MPSLKQSLASGHTVEHLPEKQNEAYRKHFPRMYKMVRLNPGGLFITKQFLNFANKYYQFQFKSSDVLVATFPKCGMTWSQEIVWTMIHNRNLDQAEGAEGINKRVPFIEIDSLISSDDTQTSSGTDDIMNYFYNKPPGGNETDAPFLQLAEDKQSPRVLKTHLPFSFLNPNLLNTCKVIFVARDPKDTCVSFHHHCRLIKAVEYVGSMEEFVNYFVKDEVCFCPYWGMVKEGWESRNHPNMLFLYYEDMKADIMKVVSKIDKFLETNLTLDQLNNICTYTSFENMKKRNNRLTKNDEKHPGYNSDVVRQMEGFFRKGNVGDSKNALTKEQLQILDDWTVKNTADMPGLKYAPA